MSQKVVVHVITRVQVVFGLPDEAGNMGQPQVLNLELQRCDMAAFQEVLELIEQKRAELAGPAVVENGATLQ